MAYDPTNWASERGNLANLILRGAPEEQITESRRNYRALRLAEYIKKQLSEDPPLSEEQRTRIAEMLLAGGAR